MRLTMFNGLPNCDKLEAGRKHDLTVAINWPVVWLVVLSISLATVSGQEPAVAPVISEDQGATWREVDDSISLPTPTGTVDSTASSGSAGADASEATDSSGVFKGPSATRYSLELSKLPDSDGQFWVVYDIEPYTERFPNLASPQDSLLDWILFDSGESFWRKEPFSILSANRNRLYAYHTSNVQRYIANVVDRFIDPLKRNAGFSIKMIALQSPDWRSRVSQYLSALPTTISGGGADVQSWIVESSNMTKVTSELERRSDYVLLNSVKNVVPNGETFGWAAAAPQKEYNRDYQVDSKSPAGYSTDKTFVDDGGVDQNVQFFNNYNYTLFAPDNAAIQAAIANGLPTWESIIDDYESLKDSDNVAHLTAKDSLRLQTKITYLNNFIRVHFLDNSVFADKTAKDETDYVTSSYDDSLGVFVKVHVERVAEGAGTALKVRDDMKNAAGNLISPQFDVNDSYKNLMARDVRCVKDGKAKSPKDQLSMNGITIQGSSFAVVHLINGTLKHTDKMPDFSNMHDCKRYLKRYPIYRGARDEQARMMLKQSMQKRY